MEKINSRTSSGKIAKKFKQEKMHFQNQETKAHHPSTKPAETSHP